MNYTSSLNNTITIYDLIRKFLEFVDKIPLTELLVGIVVPILAAWISYTLVERTTRRKESNRLYIQIELVNNELRENKNFFNKFIIKYEERIKLRKELEFPLIFCKDILIELLGKLLDIKKQYLYFDSINLHEKPSIIYIIAQQIESIDQKIQAKELKYYNDEYLDAKQKDELSKLKEVKENYINEYKSNMDRNIYIEFLQLQTYIENNIIENMFEKMNPNDVNFEIFKYIYNSIKRFNYKKDKDKSDVAQLYNELILFSKQEEEGLGRKCHRL